MKSKYLEVRLTGSSACEHKKLPDHKNPVTHLPKTPYVDTTMGTKKKIKK